MQINTGKGKKSLRPEEQAAVGQLRLYCVVGNDGEYTAEDGQFIRCICGAKSKLNKPWNHNNFLAHYDKCAFVQTANKLSANATGVPGSKQDGSKIAAFFTKAAKVPSPPPKLESQVPEKTTPKAESPFLGKTTTLPPRSQEKPLRTKTSTLPLPVQRLGEKYSLSHYSIPGDGWCGWRTAAKGSGHSIQEIISGIAAEMQSNKISAGSWLSGPGAGDATRQADIANIRRRSLLLSRVTEGDIALPVSPGEDMGTSLWFRLPIDAKVLASMIKTTVVVVELDTPLELLGEGCLNALIFSPDYGDRGDQSFTLDASGCIPAIDTALARGLNMRFLVMLYSFDGRHFTLMSNESGVPFETKEISSSSSSASGAAARSVISASSIFFLSPQEKKKAAAAALDRAVSTLDQAAESPKKKPRQTLAPSGAKKAPASAIKKRTAQKVIKQDDSAAEASSDDEEIGPMGLAAKAREQARKNTGQKEKAEAKKEKADAKKGARVKKASAKAKAARK